MTAFLVKIFGDNWRTSLFGVLQFVAGTAYNYIQSLAPGATFDYHVFFSQLLIAGLALIAKDAKVTGGKVQAEAPGTLPSTTEAGVPK